MSIYAISNAQGQNYDKYDVNKKLLNLGIPDDVIAQGEQAIEDYASLNNITLPTSDKQESKPKKNLIENQVAQVPPPKQEGVGEQMDKLA